MSVPSILWDIKGYPRHNSTDIKARVCSDSNAVPREEIDGCIFYKAPDIASRRSALQANTFKTRVAASCQNLSARNLYTYSQNFTIENAKSFLSDSRCRSQTVKKAVST